MPGTRLFLFICVTTALGLLTLGVLSSIAAASAASPAAMPAAAVSGFGVWRANGCAGCHTLGNQGGSYAPDLTHIAAQRGDAYLREFMENPGAFHPDPNRTMPRFNITVQETNDLIAFLTWVGQQPEAAAVLPVTVSGTGGLSGMTAAAAAAAAAPTAPRDPVADGRYWFSRAPANCATCHSLDPDVIVIGPSLAGVAARAASRVPGQTAEQYLRDSILHPGDFIVPGFGNVMAQNLAQVLSSEQIDHLVAFLLTLN